MTRRSIRSTIVCISPIDVYKRQGKASFPSYAATTMYEALFDEWYATGFGAVLKALGNNDLTCLLYTSTRDGHGCPKLNDQRLCMDAKPTKRSYGKGDSAFCRICLLYTSALHRLRR